MKIAAVVFFRKKAQCNSVEELLEIQRESLDNKALSGEHLSEKKLLLELKIEASVLKLEIS
jgi:hypothetical protein